MWYGVTPEFWARATLAANEVRQWSDVYFPTLGLREVTAASEYGALYLSASEAGAEHGAQRSRNADAARADGQGSLATTRAYVVLEAGRGGSCRGCNNGGSDRAER
jgi:hypothetical protein